MKIVDSNGKLFGKLNLLDLVILLILVILLAGGVYKLAFVDNTVYIPDYKEGTFDIRLHNLRDYEVQALTVGDVVAVPKIQDLGTISDIKIEKRVDLVNGADGKVYPTEHPLYYSVVITVKTEQLEQREDLYYVGKNYQMIDGQTLDIVSGVVSCKGNVIAIDIAE